MPKWDEITVTDEYKSLPPQAQAEVKTEWFKANLLPEVEKLDSLREMGADKVYGWFMQQPDDTGEGALTSAASSFARGALRPLSDIPIAVGALTGSEGIEKFGRGIQEGVESRFPVNPIQEGFFTTEIPGVAGQVASMLAGGGAGAVGVKALGGTAKAAQLGAKTAVGTQAFAGGTAGGASSADVLGLKGGERIARSLLGGVTELASEAIPFGMGAETGLVRNLLGESVESGAGRILTSGATEAAEEGFAETAGQATDIAFRPEQASMDLSQIGKAMLLGGAGGVLMGGINSIGRQTPLESQTPVQQSLAAEINAIPTDLVPDQTDDEKLVNMNAGGTTVVDPQGKTAVIAPPAPEPPSQIIPKELVVKANETSPDVSSSTTAFVELNENLLKTQAEGAADKAAQMLAQEQAAQAQAAAERQAQLEATAPKRPLANLTDEELEQRIQDSSRLANETAVEGSPDAAFFTNAAEKYRAEKARRVAATTQAATPAPTAETLGVTPPPAPTLETPEGAARNAPKPKATQTASGKKLGDKIVDGENVAIVNEYDQSTPGMPTELTVLEVDGIVDAKSNKVFATRRDMTPNEITVAQEKIRQRNALAKEMGMPQEEIPQPITPQGAAPTPATEGTVMPGGSAIERDVSLRDKIASALDADDVGSAILLTNTEKKDVLERELAAFIPVGNAKTAKELRERFAAVAPRMTKSATTKARLESNARSAEAKLRTTEDKQQRHLDGLLGPPISDVSKDLATDAEQRDPHGVGKEAVARMWQAEVDDAKSRYETAALQLQDYLSGSVRAAEPKATTTKDSGAEKGQEVGIGSVYQTKLNNQPQWAVQTSNKRGFGDYLFDTEEEALKAGEIERKNSQSRAKSIEDLKNKERQEAEKKASQEEVPRKFAQDLGMKGVSAEKAVSVLSQPASRRSQSAGKIYSGTKADVVSQMVQDGYIPKKRGNDFVLEKGDGDSIFKVTKTEHDFAAWTKDNSTQESPQTTTVATPTETAAPLAKEAAVASVVQQPAEGSIPAVEQESATTTIESNEKADIADAAMAFLEEDLTESKRQWSPEKIAAAKAYFASGGKDMNVLRAAFPKLVGSRPIVQAYLKADKEASEAQAKRDAADAKLAKEIERDEKEQAKAEAAQKKRDELNLKTLNSLIQKTRTNVVQGTVNPTDANQAVAILNSSGEIPNVLFTWIGTSKDFLADPANRVRYPETWVAVSANSKIEGMSENGQPIVFTDNVGVSDLDRKLANLQGTTPEVAAVRRVILHENIHKGMFFLSMKEKMQIFAFLRRMYSPEELDSLAKSYSEYADWRTNQVSYFSILEEAMTRDFDSMVEIPRDGIWAEFIQFLRGIWQKITGKTSEPTLKDYKDVFRLIRNSLKNSEKANADMLVNGGGVRMSMSEFLSNVTPEQDAAYAKAVSDGDMETAQTLVDEAAEKAGLPILNENEVTAYKVRRKPAPKKTEKAYKLFRVKKGSQGEVFALFVGANDPLPQGIWLDATEGPRAEDSKTGKAKVKSKLGPLAYRPGWHAGDVPLATHIGASDIKGGPIVGRKFDEVWAEVDMASDVDYQPEANANGVTKDGSISVALADIKKMPEDGLYRYKTNPNMTGQWIISGSMKINRILSENEVNSILEKASLQTMPWMEKPQGSKTWSKTPLNLEQFGLGTNPAANQKKLLDTVTYDDQGNVIPLSRRFQAASNDIRFSKVEYDSPNDAAFNSGAEVARNTDYDERDKEVRSTIRAAYDLAPKPNGPSVPLDELFSIVQQSMPDLTETEFSRILQGLYEDSGALLIEGEVVPFYTSEEEARHAELESKFNAGTITEAETAEAQAMVDAAAEKAGYKTKAYHKTWESFNEFIQGGNLQETRQWLGKNGNTRTLIGKSGKGFFFSLDKENTPAYHNQKKTGEKILNVYLKYRNPLVFDKDTEEWAIEVFGDGNKEFPRILTNEAYDFVKGDYDSIELYNKGFAHESKADEVIVLDPNQIKSADPFTGVPLNQRFDTGNDIRGNINTFTTEGERAGSAIIMPPTDMTKDNVISMLRGMSAANPVPSGGINQELYDTVLTRLRDFISNGGRIPLPIQLDRSGEANMDNYTGKKAGLGGGLRQGSGVGRAGQTDSGTPLFDGLPEGVQGVIPQAQRVESEVSRNREAIAGRGENREGKAGARLDMGMASGGYTFADYAQIASRIGARVQEVSNDIGGGLAVMADENGATTILINAAQLSERMAGISFGLDEDGAIETIGNALVEELIHAADLAVQREAWLASGRRKPFTEFAIDSDKSMLEDMRKVVASSNDPVKATRILFDAIQASRQLYGAGATPSDIDELFSSPKGNISSVMSEFVRQMIQQDMHQTVSEASLFRRFIERVMKMLQKIRDAIAPAKAGEFGDILKNRINETEMMLAMAYQQTGARASMIDPEDAATKQFAKNIKDINSGTAKAPFGGVQFTNFMPIDRTVKSAEEYSDAAIKYVNSLENEGVSLDDIANSVISPAFLESIGIEQDLMAQDALTIEVRQRVDNAARKAKSPDRKKQLSKLSERLSAFWQGVGSKKGQHLGQRRYLVNKARYSWMFIREIAEKAMKEARTNILISNFGSENATSFTQNSYADSDKANQQAVDENINAAEEAQEFDQDAADLAAGEATLTGAFLKLYEELKDLLRELGILARLDAQENITAKASITPARRSELATLSKDERAKLREKNLKRVGEILNTLLGKEEDANTPEKKTVRKKREKMVEVAKKRADKGLTLESLESDSALSKMLREINRARPGEQAPLSKQIPWRQLLSQSAKTVEEYRQRIFDAISANEELKNATPEQKARLADLFAEAWESNRTRILDGMLERMIRAEEAKKNLSKEGAKALQAQRMRIVEDINLGIFDNDELAKRMAEKFGIKSEFTEMEREKINSLIEVLQDEGLNAVKRQVAAYKLLEVLQGELKIPVVKMLADFWVSSVLSGPNTIVSIGLAVASGAFELSTALSRVFIAGFTNPKQLPSELAGAYKTLARLLSAYGRQARIAWQYLVSGDPVFLDPSMNDVTENMQWGNIGKSNKLAEQMAKSDKILVKSAGLFMRTVSRLLTALDVFNSGLTKESSLSIVFRQIGLDPAKIAEMEKKSDLKPYKDTIIQQDFKNTPPKSARDKAILDSYALADMMAELDKLGNVSENANFFGQQGAMTLDPSGLGGVGYRAIRSLVTNAEAGADRFLKQAQRGWNDSAQNGDRILSGLELAFAYFMQFAAYNAANFGGVRFARFAGNKFNQGLSLIPGIGFARAFEAEFDPNRISGKEAFIDSIRRNQLIGVMLSVAGYQILKAIADEPDDEKRGWFINGGWGNLTPEKKQQKLAAGEKEYTIGINGKVFNYANWPISSVLAAIGSLSDLIRFSPDQWNDKNVAQIMASAAMSGAAAAADIPALSQFQELFGNSLSSKDPNEKRMERFAKVMSSYAGGFVPRFLKDIDYAQDPNLRKYETLWEKTASHIPVYRRYEGKEYYDILGQQIQRNVYPGSREFMVKPTDPAYKVLGALNSRGIWLTPANAEHRMVGKGARRRSLTQEEADNYSLETGKGYKQMLLRYGQRALQMPTERARAFLLDKADEVRDRALKKVYRGYQPAT